MIDCRMCERCERLDPPLYCTYQSKKIMTHATCAPKAPEQHKFRSDTRIIFWTGFSAKKEEMPKKVNTEMRVCF